MVECQLPKLDVAGSTPVARSTNFFKNQVVDDDFRVELLSIMLREAVESLQARVEPGDCFTACW